MSPSHERFVHLDCTQTRQLSTATSGNPIQTSGTGALEISGSLTKIHLHKAIYKPTLRHKLMLVHRITECGHSVLFQGNRVTIYSDNTTIATGTKTPSGLYKIDLMHDSFAFNIATPAESSILPFKTWHERLSHLGHRNIQKLPSMASGIAIQDPPNSSSSLCKTCLLLKHTYLPHPWSSTVYQPGTLTHTNVIGPLPLGYDGSKYTINHVKHASCFAFVFTIASKEYAEALDTYKHAKGRIKNIMASRLTNA